jgi:hypothetical protein
MPLAATAHLFIKYIWVAQGAAKKKKRPLRKGAASLLIPIYS